MLSDIDAAVWRVSTQEWSLPLRSIKRYSTSLALLIALAISLAGCMHMDRSVTLNSDGSGSYTLTIGFSEQLVSLASDQLSSSMNTYGDKVKSQGGSYRHYDDTGYSYWAFTRPFKSVAELNTLVQDLPQTGNTTGAAGAGSLPTTGQSDTLEFTQQSSFMSNTFHVTGHMSMILPSSATDTGGVDVTPYLKDLRESFSVTMPGSITSHKGGVVSGNTVTYTVHYGEETDIDVVGGGLNTALLLPIGAGAGVVLLLIIAGAIIWQRRRGKNAAQLAPEAAPAFVAAAPDAPTVPGFGASPDGPGASGVHD